MHELPKARTNQLIIKELAYETLVYDRENDKAHCLNNSSALVFRNCDGNKSVSDLAQLLATETKTEVSEAVVWARLRSASEVWPARIGADYALPSCWSKPPSVGA